VQQYVLRFEISVHNALRVQVEQRCCNLLSKERHRVFCKRRVLNNVSPKVASVAVLQSKGSKSRAGADRRKSKKDAQM